MIRRLQIALALLLCVVLVLSCSRFRPPFDVAATALVEAQNTISNENIAPEPASLIDAAVDGKSAQGARYMAVTANAHSTRAAQAILERGGSAIDAAIAAQMVLGLVEPQSSGIGGGGFILYWDAGEQRLSVYDGRETAPILADQNLFLSAENNQPLGYFDAVIGGRSVGVPGLLAMLETAHSQHGELPWRELFGAAIALAEKGFAVSQRMHTMIRYVPKLDARAAIGDYLFLDDGSPLPVGHVLTNSEYAETLTRLASDGSESFYRGDIAAAIVDAVNGDKNPGTLSLEDMATYHPKQRAPFCKTVFAKTVCTMPPPSSGGSTTLAILGTLEALNIGDKKSDELSLLHQFAEASLLAYADRDTYLADSDFVFVPYRALVNSVYLQVRAALIDAERAMPDAQAGLVGGDNTTQRKKGRTPELPSTTHMSIVDADGNVLSMTSSIETAFGSRLFVKGFLLNNQLTDFSFLPVDENAELIANRVQGGKRPRSSMTPTIVFDENNRPELAIGSPGGSRIISYVARVLYEVLALGRPLQASMDAPHLSRRGAITEVEKGLDQATISGLQQLGHSVKVNRQTSGIHAIQRHGDTWLGVADSRREGVAIGR